MAAKIFVDTGVWLALADSEDSYHEQAMAAHSRLVEARSSWVTTNLVVAESYVLILRRGGHSAAVRFLDFVRNSGDVLLIYSILETEILAEAILRKYKDQAFSFVDAVSFAVMQEQKIATAFSFDSHFLVAGFNLVSRQAS